MGTGPREVPGASAPASQGRVQLPKLFCTVWDPESNAPRQISCFPGVSTEPEPGSCFDSQPEQSLEILGRLEPNPKVWSPCLVAQKPCPTAGCSLATELQDSVPLHSSYRKK